MKPHVFHPGATIQVKESYLVLIQNETDFQGNFSSVAVYDLSDSARTALSILPIGK
jgi:hypothetical protein